MSEKWIAVIGSPRRGRNTELLTEYIIEGLRAKDIIVDKHFLESRNMATCTGCEYCIKEGVCNIQDGISDIISSMKTADGFIFASPSHNYNVTAQMKALLDRTFCLNDYNGGVWSSRLKPGKKAIILGVCAGKDKKSMGYTVEGMVKPLSELGVKIIDVIAYYNTKVLPVAENSTIREHIVQRVNLTISLNQNSERTRLDHE